MRRRVTLVVLALSAAAVLGSTSGAQARCDQGGPAAGHSELTIVPGTGSHVYNDGGAPGSTSGYIGIHGSIGYIEAGGNASPSGSIQGSTTDGSTNAKLSGNSADGPRLCVNDTVIL